MSYDKNIRALDKLFASIYPKIDAELMTDLSIRISMRPTVIDAARVLEIEEKDVVDILRSSRCITREDAIWAYEEPGMLLDERSVSCLMKFNRKKLNKYYRSAQRATMSMSEEEKRTFDNFVRLYTKANKSKSKYRIDQNKIDKAFLKELFQTQDVGIIYSMTQAEIDALNEVRNSVYYHVIVNETFTYDAILGIMYDWVGGAAGSQLLHAARLGLVFDGKQESAVIFRLSEEKNAEGDRTLNTKLDGAVLEEGSVLTWTGTAAKAVADPAVLTKDRAVGADGTVPEKPLLEMELGRVYQVDVYFYLEGCDPDCTESIAFDDGYLHLAFYGVLC